MDRHVPQCLPVLSRLPSTSTCNNLIATRKGFQVSPEQFFLRNVAAECAVSINIPEAHSASEEGTLMDGFKRECYLHTRSSAWRADEEVECRYKGCLQEPCDDRDVKDTAQAGIPSLHQVMHKLCLKYQPNGTFQML
ncbi:hypothetical protein ANANG_G00148940 [Anguilla anguilla]|uniref:Uncharacterized protein n=1 Tax=Anguilla anguilla TaxID=7936 RepID=A0A9D3MCP6_ANGAN|nr:hypothetical protein ANANG_G00148940 [Anguilla anguilla]